MARKARTVISCRDPGHRRTPQHIPIFLSPHLPRTIELSCSKRAAAQNTVTVMDKAKISRAGDTESPVIVPPRLAPQSQSPHPVRTSASPFPIIQRPQNSPPHAVPERDGSSGPISDLMPHLHRSAPSIVKTRSGSVLSRGFILKTDHYPSGKPSINLLAPLTDPHPT